MCKEATNRSTRSRVPVFIYLIVAIIAIVGAFKPDVLEPVQPGDTVLITGTSSGIGKHAALSLAKEGYTVFACVRKKADGDALLESAKTHKIDAEKIKILILDVTNSKHIAKGVEIVSSHVGDRGLKGLFNNAGIGGELRHGTESTAVEFNPMQNYRDVFDVNFFGLVETTKAFLKLLRKGKGRIVMNTSVAGYIGMNFMSSYAASKHAVEGFSDSLRRELLPHGVKVSILECGFVKTPILSGALPNGIEPYREAEVSHWKRFWKDSVDAPTPKVSSMAVIHALRAAKPKVRYVVGKDSAILKFFKFLPGGFVDFLLSSSYDTKEKIGEDELKELVKNTRTEFEL